MSEKEELRRLGAVPQPNSGRGVHRKGDGVLDNKYVVDVKEYGKSYSLSVDSWAKICADASASRLEPLLNIVLGTDKKVRIVAITQTEFLELKWKADQYDATA